MGKYICLWEADESKIPIDPAERKVGWQMATAMVREDFNKGLTKDYGVFLGQPNGFTIVEGTEEEVTNMTLQYMPFFRFKVIPIISLDKVEAAINAMP
jgi:hypothetical protein